jgi:hypothetical protein
LALRAGFNVNCEYLKQKSIIYTPRLAWYKATLTDLQCYAEKLDFELNKISIPGDCIDCIDILCSKHLSKIETFYHDIVKSCLSASQVIPKTSNCNENKNVAGWSLYCADKRKDALFWHNAWKQAGRPHSGHLADMRRSTRLMYHKAVKNVKKNQDVLRNERMCENVLHNNHRSFWQEVRKLRGNNSAKIPPVIDGISGDDAIAEVFAKKFQNVFNSVGYDTHRLQNTLSVCNDRLKVLEIEKIKDILMTEDDVRNTIKKLKSGKNDGNIGFFSDHVINGTPLLVKMIKSLFNMMIIHGQSPRDMMVGTTIPIPKGKRLSVNKSDNFRGICLQSVLCKLLDLHMLAKEKCGFQSSDMQFGFKNGVSTSMATAIVMETIDYYLENSGCVYMLALDATKAFDRVEFNALFEKLLSRNINPLFIRLLYNMYIGQELRVKFNSKTSKYFHVANGVKQGGVLSPTLFSIYIDDMLCNLKKSNMGCSVGDSYVGCVAYADDIILLAPTITALRKQISIVENYASDHNIKFNGSKSKLMYVGQSENVPNTCISVNCETVEWVKCLSYLGHTIFNNRAISDVQGIKKDFVCKFNSLAADMVNVNSTLKSDLFYKYCMSLYGVSFCNFADRNEMNVIYTEWRKAMRRIWRLPYRAHGRLLSHIAECKPVDIELQSITKM